MNYINMNKKQTNFTLNTSVFSSGNVKTPYRRCLLEKSHVGPNTICGELTVVLRDDGGLLSCCKVLSLMHIIIRFSDLLTPTRQLQYII